MGLILHPLPWSCAYFTRIWQTGIFLMITKWASRTGENSQRQSMAAVVRLLGIAHGVSFLWAGAGLDRSNCSVHYFSCRMCWALIFGHWTNPGICTYMFDQLLASGRWIIGPKPATLTCKNLTEWICYVRMDFWTHGRCTWILFWAGCIHATIKYWWLNELWLKKLGIHGWKLLFQPVANHSHRPA